MRARVNFFLRSARLFVVFEPESAAVAAQDGEAGDVDCRALRFGESERERERSSSSTRPTASAINTVHAIAAWSSGRPALLRVENGAD